jgi:hypothetical protein
MEGASMRSFNTRGRLAASVLLACAASSCGSMGPRATGPGAALAPVKPGEWGGQHIALTVAAAKSDVEFDCGKGTISGVIETDAEGVFTATGTFLPERPGPTTPNAPASRPMRLTGTVKGDDMQVRIVLTDTDEAVGDFTLTLGTLARLIRCR